MGLLKISHESQKSEKAIHESIMDSVDKSENIVFTSGAGAGKTYALIETLKHIIRHQGKKLSRQNQHVLCITYTNSATDEIKKRLGNSEIVKTSTIHECLWGLINSQQTALLKVHIKEIENTINEIDQKLLNDPNEKNSKIYQAYRNLTADDKEIFCRIMEEQKDSFYKILNKNSATTKAYFEEKLSQFKILSNIEYFKKTVLLIYKVENLKKCLKKIYDKNEAYQKVVYYAGNNTDKLHRMLISHDTLLRYSHELFKDYDVLKQITIDKNPYILIDEYQDTDSTVIKIMQLLDDHSKKINHNLFIGYFGDPVQNIYDSGVGSKLQFLHKNLKVITKPYNRRSHTEIITVINKIRGDGIEQKSIYEDDIGGNVYFYERKDNSGDSISDINKFIGIHKEKWNICDKNKLHCLILLNKTIAEISGFLNVYSKFSEFISYDQINTELLSHDLNKLGSIPKLFFNILNSFNLAKQPNISLSKIIDLIDDSIEFNLTLNDASKLINEMRSIKGRTFSEYLNSIFSMYKSTQTTEAYRNLVHSIFEIHDFSLISLEEYLFGKLIKNSHEDDIEENKNKIKSLLEIDIDQYLNWHGFIVENDNSDVMYHTYHSTKGREFRNVVIIMQDDFGRQGKSDFSNFFHSKGENLEKTRNLLYVACSRSIENLSILYLDDISDFRLPIENYFGKVAIFSGL